jgi:hypothetical protein
VTDYLRSSRSISDQDLPEFASIRQHSLRIPAFSAFQNARGQESFRQAALGIVTNGSLASLEEAKAQLRSAWRRCAHMTRLKHAKSHPALGRKPSSEFLLFALLAGSYKVLRLLIVQDKICTYPAGHFTDGGGKLFQFLRWAVST